MSESTETVCVESNDQHTPDPQIPLLAQLRAERNRWFMTTLICSAIIGLLVLFCWYAFAKAERNQEIIYVKLEPNGAWAVIDYQPDDSQLFFKTTVDASLERYAMARYAHHPATIESDWGEASVFMSPEMANYFVSAEGFDAWGKIETLRKSNSQAEITVRGIEHYDQVDYLSDADTPGKAIRSNIYLSRTLTIKGEKKPPELLVLSVQWRLVSKAQLVKQSKDFIRINPIGVEILTEQLKKERSRE